MEKYFKYSQCLRLSIGTVHYNQMKRRRQHCSETKFLAQHLFDFLVSPSHRVLKMFPHTSQLEKTLHHPDFSRHVQPKLMDLQNNSTRNPDSITASQCYSALSPPAESLPQRSQNMGSPDVRRD